MDLWDVTKVLWRRRWIALPLLLVSALVGIGVLSTVRADYQATGHITLLPPSQTRPADPKNASPIVSPWNVYSLADALVIYASRGDVKHDIQAAGFSEEFTATIGGTQLPIIEVEVVASSPELARSSLGRLIEILNAQLERLQAPFGVKGGEAITAETLDSGQNIKEITSARKRMLIVIFAVGMIITVTVSLALDAVLRRRGRRTTNTGDAEDVHGGTVGAAAGSRGRAQPDGTAGPGRGSGSLWRSSGSSMVSAGSAKVPTGADRDSGSETQVIDLRQAGDRNGRAPAARVTGSPTGPQARPASGIRPVPDAEERTPPEGGKPNGRDSVVLEYRVPGSSTVDSTGPPQPASEPARHDETVILPVAVNGWSAIERPNHRPKGARDS